MIADALDRAGEETGGELESARRLARRRRLGPWRAVDRQPGDPDAARAQHQKDLAALARAGFAFEIARAALDPDIESED